MNPFESRVFCLLALVLACAGCEQPSASPAANSTASPNSKSPLPPPIVVPAGGDELAAPVPPANHAAPPVVAQQPPPATPAPAPPPPASPPAASARAMRLSTGIALAQTLPDGTGMLCSMEYEWTAGGPQQGVEYVWVIELGDGQRMSGSANVSKRSGTVQAALRGIRPERGPFKAALFSKGPTPGIAPKQLSEFIQLTN